MNSYFSGICQTGDYQSPKLRLEKTLKEGDLVPSLIKNSVTHQVMFPDSRINCRNWLTCCSAKHHKILCEVAGSQTESNPIDLHLGIPVWYLNMGFMVASTLTPLADHGRHACLESAYTEAWQESHREITVSH